MNKYLSWDEKTITDFSDKNINTLYDKGYVFTRIGKGVMHQTRSVRIDLSKFELSSENRRILKKIEGMDLNIDSIPYKKYDWQIGKMAKNFYDEKFGKGVFTANKIKEIMTDRNKSNFNTLFVYSLKNQVVGYTICASTNKILHYSYPFYNLSNVKGQMSNVGIGMMIMAIIAAKQNDKKYIYLGSAQRPTDVYKLQFKGLEWFDKNHWSDNIDELKNILKEKSSP